ncbi:MAG: molybdopterin oxidoreductase family protein [Candidatus Baltobacteraceae bacterium]
MKRAEILDRLFAASGVVDLHAVSTSCRFCNVGCGYRVLTARAFESTVPDLPIVRLDDGRYVQLVPDGACPVNAGDYSVRGAYLSETLYRKDGPTRDRLRYPLVRVGGRMVRSTWQSALDHVAEKLKGYVERFGPSSIGIYHADWFGGENAYAYMKFAAALKITNYDLNGRLCAATGSAGLARSLGNASHPWALDDIEAADTIVLAGANASATLSVIYDRIYTRVQNDAKLIVVDVRETEAARAAAKFGTFVRIRPGSDVAFYNAIGNVLLQERLYDETFVTLHTNGLAEYRNLVLDRYAPENVERIVGVPAATIRAVARTIGTSKRTLFLSGKGLEHQAHGTDMICSLIDLALLTGNMGRVGGSYSPLGGHQGSIVNPPILAGSLAHVTIPNKTIFEQLDAIEAGEQKALLCASVQPLVTLPNAGRTRKVLRDHLDFLVVTDIYPNETTELAHVIFPAASWGESPYVSTNTERRARFYDAFADAPGESKPDWFVPAELGKRLGEAKQFAWRSSEEVFDELKVGTPFAGLSYDRLRAAGSNGFQIPVPTTASEGTKRLYSDGKFPTPDGRAQIWALDYLPQPELPDTEYPLTLVTGRENDLWQSGYTFSRIPQLVARSQQNTLSIHPADARRSSVRDGARVRVASRRGSVDLVARVTEEVPQGVLFTLWGYPGSLVNEVTLDVRDPISQEPGFKACAVSVASATG